MELIMETPSTDTSCGTGGCEKCAQVAQEAEKNDEISFAFLLALVPVISLTFFGQMGLL